MIVANGPEIAQVARLAEIQARFNSLGIGKLKPESSFAQWLVELRKIALVCGELFPAQSVHVSLAPGFFRFIVDRFDDEDRTLETAPRGRAAFIKMGLVMCKPDYMSNWYGRAPFKIVN